MSATEKTMKDIARILKKVLTMLRFPYDHDQLEYDDLPAKEK